MLVGHVNEFVKVDEAIDLSLLEVNDGYEVSHVDICVDEAVDEFEFVEVTDVFLLA